MLIGSGFNGDALTFRGKNSAVQADAMLLQRSKLDDGMQIQACCLRVG